MSLLGTLCLAGIMVGGACLAALPFAICVLGDAGREARKKRGEKLGPNPFVRPGMR